MPDVTQVPTVRRFGVFEVNLQSGELRKNGIRRRLSGQPFQILAILIKHHGEVVTREELHSRLWPADTFVDFDHGLNNAVARIREVLDDSSDTPRYIETLPRRGYRFIAPLIDLSTVVAPPPATQRLDSDKAMHSGFSTPPFAGGSNAFLSRKAVLISCAVTLAIAGIAFLLYRSRVNHEVQPMIRSLAVLPLKNLSGDAAQDYFADGMTEEIIGRLSMIRGLRVISRTSVMRFKNSDASEPEIAKSLGADAIVEGSVIRAGSRIRVHAQLIRATTDEHFWSETYDRDLGDVLALQSEIAQSIASKVEVTLTGGEHSRFVAARQVSPEVYESYLRGEFALHKSTRADVEESIQYFEQAINNDPKFAPAYLALAHAYDELGTVFTGAPSHETHAKVINEAQKALELDEQLADAHVLLGDTYRKQWRWTESEAEYKRALDLVPNNAAAHMGYASWLLSKDRPAEAINWAQRGRELDPVYSTTTLAWILFQERRYGEAAQELHAALAVTPEEPYVLWFLGFVLVAEDKPADAIPVLEKAVFVSHGSPGARGVLVRAYAHAGRRKDAFRVLNELKRQRQVEYVPAGALVQAYMGVNDKEQALVWLDQAYKEESNLMQFIGTENTFDPLRGDPRFADLLHRVGLGQAR